ncbi:MAG: tRNA pseudouridine(55) synthase TruB [Pleurocapsa sp.]
MFGLINLNKPVGFTSHDCIAKLRKLLKTKKIGHGGTLDPTATGVLPVAVGKATKLLQFLPEPKVYRALIRLGVTTTTDDLAGEIIKSVTEFNLTKSQIIDSLNNFVGTIEQVPPIYSAIKQNGRKLYELARKGEKITVEPRSVTISKIELLNIYQTDFYELEIDVYCSPGTYIRAIARDLGANLGVGGTLANLVRTKSCGMQLKDSVTFEEIENQLQLQTFSLIEPSVILNHLDSVILADDDCQRWCQGQLIDLSQAQINSSVSVLNQNNYVATYAATGTFVGISLLIERNDTLKIKPKIVLNSNNN